MDHKIGPKDNSPMMKFRSTLKVDSETKKWYHMAIVLRENGRVEFYSDFTYVDKYDQEKCVNIEDAGDRFILRCTAAD